jgi:serine/threonine-protein kinase
MLPASSNIGPYRIVEHIATGGMGEVYRAADMKGRELALKVIRPEVANDPGLRSMFESEARVALALDHHNVVHTYEVQRRDGRLVLAMEHVDGLDVARLLLAVTARREPMPIGHAVLIATDALTGLDYAHGSRGPGGEPLGLIHRDISPGNILVSCEGEAKIADFGVAVSRIRVHQSMVGTLKGKLAYMSPEQLRGEPLDQLADVYSMGIVLYEMLTSRRPFVGTGPSIIPDVLSARYPRPGLLRADLPEDLESVVMTAMSADPRGRFQSAAAMSFALSEVASESRIPLSRDALGAFVRSLRVVARHSSPPSGESTLAASPRGRRFTPDRL